MKILIINSGSTSIKFKLFDMPKEKISAYGKLEKIGGNVLTLNYWTNNYTKVNSENNITSHKVALKLILEKLSDSKTGVIKKKGDINAIGHRVVNIGDRASTPLILDDEVIGYIEDCLDLAPLHNPPNLLGIKLCKKIFGKSAINVAVFDNIFHKDIPKKAYLYGIPYCFYKKYKIRKYGFHGIAYTYMVERISNVLKKDLKYLKIIALMLGGGSSVTAIANKKTVDTSMGFTPTEGLIMSTRSGDLDPSVIGYVMKKEGIDVESMNEIINKRSGLLGLSEKYDDFKDIENGVLSGDKDCIRAFNSYCYRIKKYIGAYAAAMNGIDAIVFGGGIGENSHMARKAILEDLDSIGIKLDEDRNINFKDEDFISAKDSKVKIAVVKVDEEVVIARETYNLLEC